MPTYPPIPTVADVERITNIPDAVMRNLQITQCYHELSAVLASHTGLSANWCTFATWASRQAGQTIRKEDLARLLDRRLRHSASTVQASEQVSAAMYRKGGNQFLRPRDAALSQDLALQAENFKTAVDRASDAVGRGNLKVFEEIGEAFARFYQTCFHDEPLDSQKMTRFCAELRDGEPPEGQGYLRQAFTHYAQALIEPNSKQRAELLLLANLEIGFHEQTRLQPEIAESLDAGFISFFEYVRALFGKIFPAKGWFHLAYLYFMRLLGRPTHLDLAIQALLAAVRGQLRQAITEIMMTIAFPSGRVLRLGDDLTIGFPESLLQITNSELASFLKKHDLTPDSLSDSGAVDWADLPDRLHFIIDLFRCYQEQELLFEPPFTPQQVDALKAGRLPDGRL